MKNEEVAALIPEDWVRLAAIAHHGATGWVTPWADLAPPVRKVRMQKMRAALEAVAPHMLGAE